MAKKAAAKKNRHMPVSKAKNAYELLDEIRKLILEEPLRYDQTDILRVSHGKTAPACRTIGCVAGWAVALKSTKSELDARLKYGGVIDHAQRILGISLSQRDVLFRAIAFFHTRPKTEEHAIAGAAHIKRFMEKHAKQLKAKSV